MLVLLVAVRVREGVPAPVLAVHAMVAVVRVTAVANHVLDFSRRQKVWKSAASTR